MKCPRCKKNQAIIDPTFGVTHCLQCRKGDVKIKEAPAFATPTMADRIQSQRDHNLGDIAQPWNTDGSPNETFIKANSKEDVEQYFPKEELEKL